MNDADREMLPLLAGWLDGELTSEETQRVEAALARSAELREVLEEWRSVDTELVQGEPIRSEAKWEALAMRVDASIRDEGEREVAQKGRQARASVGRSWQEHPLALWFGSHQWTIGGGGAVAVATLAILFWAAPEELLYEELSGRQEMTGLESRREKSNREAKSAANHAFVPAPEFDAPSGVAPKEKIVDQDSRIRGGRSGKRSAAIILEKETPTSSSRADKVSELAPARDAGVSDTPLSDALASSAPPVVTMDDAVLKIRAENRSGDLAQRASDPNSVDAKSGFGFLSSRMSKPTRQRSFSGGYVVRDTSAAGFDHDTLQRELDEAIQLRDRDALQRVISDIDRRRPETSGDTALVSVLGLEIRARGELLRMFPDLPENNNACNIIRTSYTSWRALADPTLLESWEGLRVRSLVREVCPD